MLVPQHELDLIGRQKMRRTMMRLPVQHGPEGERKACPMSKGRVYKLQAQVGGATVKVTVTDEPHMERLAALSASDAKREGYAGVAGALAGWERRHGEATLEQMVWVVPFVKGDLSTFMGQDDSVYLCRVGDYTTRASGQAVKGDPPLMPMSPVELAKALARARDRQLPQTQALQKMRAEAETLRESLAAMNERNGLRELGVIVKQLDRLDKRFSVGGDGTVEPSDACVERIVPAAIGEPTSDTGSPMRPDLAA